MSAADTPEPPRLPRDVVAWGTVSFFSDLGHATVSSLLPAFLMGLGAPPLSLGVIEGIADGAASVTKLISGRLADRLQRVKPPAIVGYLATGLAMPAIALAQSWPVVLVLRTTAWLGKGLRSPLRDTLLVRAVDPRQRGRAFGVERAMDQLGSVLAPLLVAACLTLHLRVPVIMGLAAIPGCAAALVVALAVRERAAAREAGPSKTRPTDEPPEVLQRAHGGALPSPFRRLLIALGVFGCGDFAKTLLVLWALGPADKGLSPGTISTAVLLYAGFNLVTVVAAGVGGRASDHVGRKSVLIAAYALGTAAALVPVAFPPTVAAASLALGLSGLLVGAEEAVERAWAADLAPGGRSGWGFGLLHAVNGLGDLVASIVLGALWTVVGAHVAFLTAGLLMGVGTLLTALVPAHSQT